MTVKIRLATATDATQIQAIYTPIVRDTFISFEEVIPDVAEIERRIKTTLDQYPYLVCEIGGQIAGYCYASAFRSRIAYQWTTETTVYVHSDYYRQRIAHSLYMALFDVLRGQGYLNAIGVIALPNDDSVNLHKKFGFKPIGIFKNMGYKINGWRDTGWWQLELSPAPPHPTTPIPISDYSQTANFKLYVERAVTSIRA